MTAEHYITRYNIVRNGKISLNGSNWYSSGEKEVNPFCKEVYEKLNIQYPRYFKMDSLSKLALVTSEVLLQGRAGIDQYKGDEVGIIMSNRSASLDTDVRFYESIKTHPSPSLFVYTLPNILIGEISIRNKIMGENAFFIFEQFDAAFMCGYVNNLMDEGEISACLMGWVEVFEVNFEAFLFLVEKEKAPGQLNLTCTAETVTELLGIKENETIEKGNN